MLYCSIEICIDVAVVGNRFQYVAQSNVRMFGKLFQAQTVFLFLDLDVDLLCFERFAYPENLYEKDARQRNDAENDDRIDRFPVHVLVLLHLRVHIGRPGQDTSFEVVEVGETVLCFEEVNDRCAALAGAAMNDNLFIAVELFHV